MFHLKNAGREIKMFQRIKNVIVKRSAATFVAVLLFGGGLAVAVEAPIVWLFVVNESSHDISHVHQMLSVQNVSDWVEIDNIHKGKGLARGETLAVGGRGGFLAVLKLVDRNGQTCEVKIHVDRDLDLPIKDRWLEVCQSVAPLALDIAKDDAKK